MVYPDSQKMTALGYLGTIVPGRWVCSGSKVANVDPGAGLSPLPAALLVPSSEYR